MFPEKAKKLFNLKKTEKNNQTNNQSLTKDLSSDENFKKFKSQKSYHTNTESQTHQKIPSTVINGQNDNNIISINLPISVKYIGLSAFGNSKLQIINYEGDEKDWKAISINVDKSTEFMNAKITFVES